MSDWDDGWVYYALSAHASGDMTVKIGHSVSVRSRIAQLPRQYGECRGQRPILLAVEPGGFPLEQQRHREFADLLIRNEWFAYDRTNRLGRWIAELPDYVSEALVPYRPPLLTYVGSVDF